MAEKPDKLRKKKETGKGEENEKREQETKRTERAQITRRASSPDLFAIFVAHAEVDRHAQVCSLCHASSVGIKLGGVNVLVAAAASHAGQGGWRKAVAQRLHPRQQLGLEIRKDVVLHGGKRDKDGNE